MNNKIKRQSLIVDKILYYYHFVFYICRFFHGNRFVYAMSRISRSLLLLHLFELSDCSYISFTTIQLHRLSIYILCPLCIFTLASWKMCRPLFGTKYFSFSFFLSVFCFLFGFCHPNNTIEIKNPWHIMCPFNELQYIYKANICLQSLALSVFICATFKNCHKK